MFFCCKIKLALKKRELYFSDSRVYLDSAGKNRCLPAIVILTRPFFERAESMDYPTTQSSLLERIQQGDEISWNDFYFRYSPVVRCVGAGYRFSEMECDDLVQQVMLKFFANSKTFVYKKGEVKFRTYFSRIVQSQAIDLYRRNTVQKNLVMDAPGNPDPFDAVFMDEWRKAVLDEAKEELRRRVDVKTYQAFELYGMQHRPAEKVMEVLGISRDSLYAAKSRCLHILQEIVKRHNQADGELNLEL